MDYSDYFSQHTTTMKSSLIRELVATTRGIPGLISFAGGFPAPATFPKQLLADIYHKVVLEEGNDVLQYGASEGDTILKQALRDWEGLSCLHDDEMLITVGSTNAIYYFARTLVNEGDVVFCEAPSFLGSLVGFEALGAELVGIEMDDCGMRLDILEAELKKAQTAGKHCKFVYTIPDFQNPTGITMNLERRKGLLEIARRYHLLILEDNPYGELRYAGEAVPSIFSLSCENEECPNIVTLVKSFSKILGPGLRIAYVAGAKSIISKMCSWQQKVTVSPDCITERVVARYLEQNVIEEHLSFIADYYRPLLNTMLDSLQQEMPSSVKWTMPEGGMFLWLTLPEDVNADELFELAKQHKITFMPGSKFYPQGAEKYNYMRLNFTFASEEQIREGVKRLAQMMHSIH